MPVFHASLSNLHPLKKKQGNSKEARVWKGCQLTPSPWMLVTCTGKPSGYLLPSHRRAFEEQRFLLGLVEGVP